MIRGMFFFVIGFGMLQMFSVVTTAASSITSERESDTLDLVLTTPLAVSSLVFGKLVASVTYILLSFSALLPFIMLCVFFGGLNAHDIAQCMCIVFSGMVFAATLGVCVSLLFRRNNTAMMISTALLLLFLAIPIPARLLFEYYFFGPIGPVQFYSDFTFWINPFWSIGSLFQPSGIVTTIALRNQGWYSLLDPNLFPGYTNALLLTGISFFLFWITVGFTHKRQLLQQTHTPRWNTPSTTKRKSSNESVNTEVTNELPPSSIGSKAWAIYNRERMIAGRRLYTRDIFSAFLILLATFLLMWYTIQVVHENNSFISVEFVYYMILVSMVLSFLIFIPFLSTTTLLSEFQRDTWALLRTTRLKSSEIAFNKIAVCMHHSLLMFAIVVLAILIWTSLFSFLTRKQVEFPGLLQLTFLFLLYSCCSFLYTSIGMSCSSQARKSMTPPVRVTLAWMLLHWALAFFIFVVVMLGGAVLNSPDLFTRGIMQGPSARMKSIANTVLWWTPLAVFRTYQWQFIHYMAVVLHSLFALATGYILFLATRRMLMARE